MAVYITKTTGNDFTPSGTPLPYTIDFNVVMSVGTGTDSTLGVTVDTFKSGVMATLSGVPNNANWGSGTFSIELELDSTNANVAARCRPVRVSSTGTVLENGDWSDQKVCSASLLFDAGDTNPPQSPSGGNWTAGNATDRLMIEWEFEKIGGHSSQSITIGTGTTANEIDSPVGENTARRVMVF